MTARRATCVKWKRVGRRRVLRCAKFKGPRRRRVGFPPGHIPANRGATCRRRKRFYSPFFDQKVLRCVEYGGRRRKASRPRKGSGRPKPPPRSRPSSSSSSRSKVRSDETYSFKFYTPLSLPAFASNSAALAVRGRPRLSEGSSRISGKVSGEPRRTSARSDLRPIYARPPQAPKRLKGTSGMARRGSKCAQYKRVLVKGRGMQRRCVKYS